MHQEIRRHGHLDETIAGHAAWAVRDDCCRYVYAPTSNRLRSFVPGDACVVGRIPLGHR